MCGEAGLTVWVSAASSCHTPSHGTGPAWTTTLHSTFPPAPGKLTRLGSVTLRGGPRTVHTVSKSFCPDRLQLDNVFSATEILKLCFTV